MANKNTKRNRVNHGFKVKRGQPVNSTKERERRGRKAYQAPTLDRHPVSFYPPNKFRAIYG